MNILRHFLDHIGTCIELYELPGLKKKKKRKVFFLFVCLFFVLHHPQIPGTSL